MLFWNWQIKLHGCVGNSGYVVISPNHLPHGNASLFIFHEEVKMLSSGLRVCCCWILHADWPHVWKTGLCLHFLLNYTSWLYNSFNRLNTCKHFITFGHNLYSVTQQWFCCCCCFSRGSLCLKTHTLSRDNYIAFCLSCVLCWSAVS